MKRRHILMAGALTLAAWLAWFGNAAPDAEVTEAVERAPRSAVRENTGQSSPKDSGQFILAISPREDLFGMSKEERARNEMFAGRSWNPPPPPPPKDIKPAAPVAPPLPFAYVGKKNEDNVWEVYLTRGEKTFIVRPQTVIDDTWRADAISASTLTLTYLPLQQAQQLRLGGRE